MSFLRRAIKPIMERRAYGQSDPWTIPPPGNALGQMSSAGTVVNDTSALSIMTFFAGVRIISDSVSMTPIRAVTQEIDGTRRPVVDKPDQITNPFVECSLQQGISQIVVSLILRGNAYLVVTDYGPKMVPIKWRILSPDQVDVQWDLQGSRVYRINGVIWDHSPVVHLTNFMLPNSLMGVGIIEYCRNALGLGVALDDVAGEFFRNGIMSTGIISVEAPMTADETRTAAAQFSANHSGVKRAHMPIVMSGGAKYTPMSLTPEDAQFIQSRQFQQGEIATLLGIPPHLLGIVDRTTSWGTGIEVQGRGFVDYTLRSYYQRLQTMFTAWLEPETYAEFITDALTRADTKTRYENYHMALVDGWQNADGIRLQEGLPPLPNGAGQIYRVPLQQVAVSDANGIIAAAPTTALPTENPNAGSQGDPDANSEN